MDSGTVIAVIASLTGIGFIVQLLLAPVKANQTRMEADIKELKTRMEGEIKELKALMNKLLEKQQQPGG